MAAKTRAVAHRTYKQEDIDYALTVVALYAGRTEKASEALKAEGKHFPQQTLNNWKYHNDGRYSRVCEQAQDQIAQKVAAQAEAVALRAAEVELLLLTDLETKRHDLKPAELAGAVRNITTTKTLNVEKVASPLRGRASTIVEHRDINEILRSLEKHAAKQPAVDSTAEEITSGTT